MVNALISPEHIPEGMLSTAGKRVLMETLNGYNKAILEEELSKRAATVHELVMESGKSITTGTAIELLHTGGSVQRS